MVSLERFLKLVIASELVGQQQLDAALERFRTATGEAATDHLLPQLLEWLVRERALTAWQGAKLLEGKYKGFWIGPYLLLDHLATGIASTRYLALDTRSQGRVEIVVVPPSKQAAYFVIPPGGLIEEASGDF